MIPIEEVMTTELYTLTVTASVHNARILMDQKKIRHLPIVDRRGRLVGLVSQRDLLAKTPSTLEDMSRRQRIEAESSLSVADIMTTDVLVVDERESLRDAALAMQAHGHGCLPIVTDGRLKGIITSADFVQVAINLLEQLEQRGPLEEMEQ